MNLAESQSRVLTMMRDGGPLVDGNPEYKRPWTWRGGEPVPARVDLRTVKGLVRYGLAETDDWLEFRITEAGRRALRASSGNGQPNKER